MEENSILIINRWNDKLACYENYTDHDKYKVSYITNRTGEKAVNKKLSDSIYVTNDLNESDNNLNLFINSLSQIDRVIAFSEVDQELAAFIRNKYSIQGMKTKDILKFRNKVTMKQVADQAGILVPRFIDLNIINQFDILAKLLIYPVILKPKNGVSSEGVYKINSEIEFHEIVKCLDKSNYELEEYINGVIYHADGIIQNNKLIIFKVSEYINTCLDYTLGIPLGSVVIDDVVLEKKLIKYTENILESFNLNDSAFHLEFIIDKENKIYFLELGARIGGAQVPYVFKNIYNIDLFKVWVDIQLKKDISIYLEYMNNENIGGWLLFPEPRNLPCKVDYCKELAGSNPIIAYELLPHKNHIFRGGGEYRDVSGCYLFKGKDTQEVKNAIDQTIQQFSIKTTLI